MTAEEDCLRLMVAGDEQALGRLYDRLGGLIYSLVRRIVGNDREAEELVQDVFVSAWRNARTFDPARASVTTWVATMARNKAIDRLRANRRRLPSPPDEPELKMEQADPSIDPAQALQRDDRKTRIMSWIGELPPNQRQAVELAFFDGLTHPEIATRLGETIGTIKSRIRLGLDRLRQKMKGDWE